MSKKENHIGEFESLNEKEWWLRCYVEAIKRDGSSSLGCANLAFQADMMVEAARERTGSTVAKLEKEKTLSK